MSDFVNTRCKRQSKEQPACRLESCPLVESTCCLALGIRFYKQGSDAKLRAHTAYDLKEGSAQTVAACHWPDEKVIDEGLESAILHAESKGKHDVARRSI